MDKLSKTLGKILLIVLIVAIAFLLLLFVTAWL